MGYGGRVTTDNKDLNLALFCDFENVALGVRDAKYAKFDIQLVLERVLLKGSIVVKKAYCDWERYKEFKPIMHNAAFELIEIPHTRQSGKNSADIRLVVDALDLCYTKKHIDIFVVISGDSDFSPLVSKLRENAKLVIGVGVKNSTSELLTHNCDEFIYYDDLIQDDQVAKKRRQQTSAKKPSAKSVAQKNSKAGKTETTSLDDAIQLVLETAEALQSDRSDGDKLWGSMIKQALKRRRPDFNERTYGVRSFSDLLEEAQDRKLISLSLDERSGGYTIELAQISPVKGT